MLSVTLSPLLHCLPKIWSHFLCPPLAQVCFYSTWLPSHITFLLVRYPARGGFFLKHVARTGELLRFLLYLVDSKSKVIFLCFKFEVSLTCGGGGGGGCFLCSVTSGPQTSSPVWGYRSQVPRASPGRRAVVSLDLLGWVFPPFVSELNFIATLYLRKIYNWKLSALVPLFISRNFRKYGHFGFIPWSTCLDLGVRMDHECFYNLSDK